MAALDTGKSWHAVSVATSVPYTTVKKYARALGYLPPRRAGGGGENKMTAPSDAPAGMTQCPAIIRSGDVGK